MMYLLSRYVQCVVKLGEQKLHGKEVASAGQHFIQRTINAQGKDTIVPVLN
jgi:hypothetical protein